MGGTLWITEGSAVTSEYEGGHFSMKRDQTGGNQFSSSRESAIESKSKGAAGSPELSIVVPTRGRPAELARFLKSLDDTVTDPAFLEVVLVTDLDDDSYPTIPRARFSVRRERMEPKLTMGGLVRHGASVAAGRFILPLNDDVVAGTKGWDRRLHETFKIFKDGIFLIHVNDGIFKELLCTFPLVSKSFCKIVGSFCPEDYVRYRIDDHIFNIFNILSFLGYDRHVYLQDVLFEHLHREDGFEGVEAYQPDPTIHALDTETYDALQSFRIDAALDLAEHIENFRLRERREIAANRLTRLRSQHRDSLRRPEYATKPSPVTSLTSEKPRVMIGVVTADATQPHARHCIEAIQRFTSNFELVLLDNRRGPNFNHSREMNRFMSICRTDLAVIMDDDVIVEAGWLEGMLRCMGHDVGVVTPMHKDRNGAISYVGTVMSPLNDGQHSHWYKVPAEPIPTQTICSAIFMVDMRKCGHIRVDESYSKYFLDIDYGLRIWESGYRVMQSPYAVVTHMAGATLQQGSAASSVLFEQQRQIFFERWIETGRWQRLSRSAEWLSDPFLRSCLEFRSDFESLFDPRNANNLAAFEQSVRAKFEMAQHCPTLRHWASEETRKRLNLGSKEVSVSEDKVASLLIGYFVQPVLLEIGYKAHNIVLWQGEYYAIPQSRGVVDVTRVREGDCSDIYAAQELSTLKLLMNSGLGLSDPSWPLAGPKLIEEGYCGFNLFTAARDYYALPQSSGTLDVNKIVGGEYRYCYSDRDLDDLKRRIRPHLVEEGYHGFDLISVAGDYFALARSEGAFDINKASRGDYRYCHGGRDLEELKWRVTPQLVEGDFHGFNFVYVAGDYFALAQAEGAFEINKVVRGEYRHCYVGRSLKELKQRVIPQLVDEDFHGFNIISVADNYVALAQSEGVFDINKVVQGGYRNCYSGGDLEEIKSRIAPQLIEQDFHGFNLILSSGRYFALAQSEGAFDLNKIAGSEYRHCYGDDDLINLKRRVTPRLVEEGYHGFNIISVAEHYVALGQSEGPFSINRAIAGKYLNFHDGRDLDELKSRVMQRPEDNRPPEQAESHVEGLNPQERPTRWREIAGALVGSARGAVGRVLKSVGGLGKSAGELSSARKWVEENSPARLLERDRGGFDIYEFEFKFFAVPVQLGQFDYGKFRDDGRLAQCVVAQSPDDLYKLLEVRSEQTKPVSILFLSGHRHQARVAASIHAPIERQVKLVCHGTPGAGPDDIVVPVANVEDIGRFLLSAEGALQLDSLIAMEFSDAVISWTEKEDWKDNYLEAIAWKVAPVVHVVTAAEEVKAFVGEGVHRLVYNKAYLTSFFSRLPQSRGPTILQAPKVLEVGCSDGLVCDILAGIGAAEVVGIDAMETVGYGFRNSKVRYLEMDAHKLAFESESFDMVVSIATFEHLERPREVMDEIIRVLRPSGYAYVQAGPLFHSPFGHHMFGYFDEYPWIHLRKSPEEIAAYAEATGVARRIEHDHAKDALSYVQGMLSRAHINGLKLDAYGLDELNQRSDISVLIKNPSYEGENLLTSEILNELSMYPRSVLIEHGFEVVIQKT